MRPRQSELWSLFALLLSLFSYLASLLPQLLQPLLHRWLLALKGGQPDSDPLTRFATARPSGLHGQLLLHRCQEVARPTGDEVADERDSGCVDLDRRHRVAEEGRFWLAQIVSESLEKILGALTQLANIGGIDPVHPKGAAAHAHAMFGQPLYQPGAVQFLEHDAGGGSGHIGARKCRRTGFLSLL